jgi:trbC/VIRB2 family
MKKFKAFMAACKREAGNFRRLLVTTFIMVQAEHAMAAGGGGVGNVKTIVDKIIESLDLIGVGVITIAIMVAGYRIAFGGQTVREVAPIVIGGVLVGAASYIAGLVLGK